MQGVSIPGPHFASARSIKVQPPKIRAVKVAPVSNGLHVTHLMSGPHPNKEFVFASPAKMVSHLKRIQDTEWLHPMNDPAKKTTSVLDLGMPA